MSFPESPPPNSDFWGLVMALVVSTVSAFISISKRILRGHQATWLWVISEYLTAILCGYLTYHAYPAVAAIAPDWFTLPMAVAIAAHSGGRIFQEIEEIILKKYIPFWRQ